MSIHDFQNEVSVGILVFESTCSNCGLIKHERCGMAPCYGYAGQPGPWAKQPSQECITSIKPKKF